MKILFLCVGATNESYLKEGCQIFENRLKHYIPTKTEVIPDLKKGNKLPVSERKKKEGDLILKALHPGDHLILLDEKGKEFNSRAFSNFLQKKMLTGIKRLVFVVGGAFGFSDEVYAKANGKISLSQMTFSHQMIRLFFLEQVYRACTIMKNEPYHND